MTVPIIRSTIEKMDEKAIDVVISRVKEYDDFYMYSDDNKFFTRGKRKEKELQDYVKPLCSSLLQDVESRLKKVNDTATLRKLTKLTKA